MPTYLFVAGHSVGHAIAASYTGYLNPAGGMTYSTTEVAHQAVARDSYTLAKLYVRVTANATTASSTIRSRKNTANGAQSVSIGAGATGVFQDSVNSDSLVAGDLFNTQVVVGAGGTLTLTIIAYTLATASNTTPIIIAGKIATHTLGTGITTYTAIGGQHWYNTTEARSQYIFRVAATLSNFRIYMRANTVNGASTFRTRKNAADGAQSFSVGASTTGAFEDTVNSDSIASGDAVAYQAVTGGSGGGTCSITIWQIKSNSAGRQVISAKSGTTTIGFGLTRYVALEAGSQDYATTEADTQVAAQASFTAKNLFVRVPTNSLNGSTTFTLRKNTAGSALTASVGASATGTFEDTTNTVSCVAADLLDWEVVTGGTSGSMEITYIGFELAQPGGVTQKTVTDALALTDATPGISAKLTLTEALGVAAAFPSNTPKALLSLTEALSLAEAMPGIKASLSLAQALTLADVLAVKASLTLAESLALTEALGLKASLTLAETLALADLVSVTSGVITKLVTDSLALSGVISGIKATLTVQESLALSEALAIKVTALVSDALALAEMVSPKQFKSIADSLAVADQVAAAVLVVRLLVLASLLKEGLEMSGTAGPALTLSAISGRGLQLESTMKEG